MLYIAIIAALLGGIFISVQGGINGMMGNETGIFTTMLIPVVTQIIILTIFLAVRKDMWINIMKLKDVKFGILFLVVSALLGLGIMGSLTFSIMKIGPLIAFGVVIFSQLLTSMILEHYGVFKITQFAISKYRLTGLLAMIIGIFLFYKK